MTTYSTARLQGISLFVQAVEAGSFSAAASRAGLSRSAVGKSVATLEARLGIRLLDRTTRRLGLTVEGEDFYRSCLRVLAELDEAEARAATGRREVSGRLRVSLPVTFGRKWVMPVLRDLARRHRKLSLDVSFTDRAVDLVEENIDLAVRLGDPGNSSSIAARRLGVQRFVVCGSPGYFAARGYPATIEDLPAHDCITFSQGGRVLPWRLAGADNQPVNIKVAGRHTISDGEALRSAVLDGMGMAQFPTWLVVDELKAGTLATVPGSREVEGFPILALWPAARELAPKIRAAVDELLGAFTPSPWE
ncbi:LysR family transcriptional regulator [Achromobacter deleyi]|nr:LysR family transcriptional regulator [Achromobacter deleyi]